jgi:hypothetical protein
MQWYDGGDSGIHGGCKLLQMLSINVYEPGQPIGFNDPAEL